MAKLYFRVEADVERVKQLREEIAKLHAEMKNVKSPKEMQNMQSQVNSATREMNGLCSAAAKTGMEMNNGLKKKIYEASQSVNGFTEKIIAQKAVVKDVAADVKRLGDAYRDSVKYSPLSSSSKLAEFKAAKAVLEEEKAALFGLTQQQATARLSVKKLRDEYAAFNDESKNTSSSVEDIAGKIKSVLGGALAGMGIKEFIGQVISVRGEFENIETSLKSLLGGSEEKMQSLMGQLKEYALISPLTTKDMASALQMMVGFGIQAEDSVKYLKALGDVSMGNAGKFNSLTLAFSQMSAAGKLMGQDLNQMINAGFNPLTTMSEKTGKSIGQLKEEMSKGAISAQMVQQAFIDATSEGGKFYGMAEAGSKTINGQMSMLQESFDNIFNDIGKQSEGVILSAISSATSLVESYETVGKVLLGVVATYGSYKAAILVVMALEKAHLIARYASIKGISVMSLATDVLTQKTIALESVLMKNPYAVITALIVGTVSALVAFTNVTNEAEEQQKRINSATENFNKEVATENVEIDRLFGNLKKAKKGTSEYQTAKDAIIDKYGPYLSGLNSEIQKLNDVKGAYNAVKKAALDAAKVRGIEASIKAEQDRYGETTASAGGKLYDSLSEKVGEDRAKKIMAAVREEISKTGKVAANTKKQIGDIFRGSFTYGSSRSWMQSLENAKENLDQGYKRVEAVFGDTETKKEDKPANEKLYTKEKAKAKKAMDDAKKEYKRISKDAKATVSEVDAAKKKADAAKSEYDKNYGGAEESKADKAANAAAAKAETAAEKRNKARQKADDTYKNLVLSNEQDVISIEEDSSEKRLKQIDHEFDERKEKINKQQKELAKLNKEAGAKGLNANGLTSSQQAEIDKANANNKDKRDKDTMEESKADINAMRDYIKQYGTFQQQKLAIAEEYAEKIHKAQTEGERMSLGKERDSKIQQVEINAMKQDIDWRGLLGDFGSMFEDQLKPTLEKLKAYAQTDKFLEANINDQKTVYELIEKLQTKTSDGWRGMFDSLGQATENYNEKLRQQEKATAKAAEDTEAYQKAVRENTIHGKNGDYIDPKAKASVDALAESMNKAANDVTFANNNVTQAQQGLAESATRVRRNFTNLVDGLQKLGSNSMSGILGGAESIAKIFKEYDLAGVIGKKLADTAGKVFGKSVGDALAGPAGGEIVEGVFALLDLFQNGIENLFSNLIDTVLGSVNGLLDSILNMKIPLAIGNSLKDGIGNILNTVTFGGFSSWIGANGNAKEVNKTTERLTARNEMLTQSIDALKDSMDKARGAQSVTASNEARRLQQEKINNASRLLATQMGYHKSHHSNNSYISGSMSADDWRRVSEKTGQNVSNTSDLWALSPESLKKVSELTDIWDKIYNGGKYDKSEYIDQYLELADSLGEIDNSLKETLTGVSFDSFYNNYLSMIGDLDKKNADFAENFEEYLYKALVNNQIGAQMESKLQGWYDNFAKSMEDGGLSDKEVADLRTQWDLMNEQAKTIRDNAAKATGYTGKDSSSQQGSSRGFDTMTQDQSSDLSGRFTALQIAGEKIQNNTLTTNEILSKYNLNSERIAEISAVHKDIAEESRKILANSYLELHAISENTSASLKVVREMKEDLSQVKKNTSKL